MMNKVTARKREMLPPIATNQNQWGNCCFICFIL